jgi:hypothetical protein
MDGPKFLKICQGFQKKSREADIRTSFFLIVPVSQFSENNENFVKSCLTGYYWNSAACGIATLINICFYEQKKTNFSTKK